MLRIDRSKKRNSFNKVDLSSGKLPQGISKEKLEKEIHVIDSKGKLHRNFDALLTILEEYPKFQILIVLGRLPGFYQLGVIGYKIFAANRHFIWGKMGRILYTKIAVALGFLASIILTEKLWMANRSFPLVPIFPFIPMQPAFADYYIFFALLLLLITITLLPNPRKVILVFTCLCALLFCFDINRLQSFNYQFFFMLIALGLFSWNYKDIAKARVVLNSCQLIIICIYFWGGLQKLNLAFLLISFPWFIEPITKLLPEGANHILFLTGVIVPFFEAGLGLGLLFKRIRQYAVIAATALHLMILYNLGPLGHNYAFSIWPWNIDMVLLLFILFWKDDASWKEILWNKNFAFQKVILILFGFLPLFSFFNAWDSYLSFSMYAGNTNYASIVFTGNNVQSLPYKISRYTIKGPNNTTVLNIPAWAYDDFNVLAYPETRVYKDVGKYVCKSVTDKSGVELYIQGEKTLFNADNPSSYSCAELE
jgi:predicted DCC family thiol-disulfide oxidoreductase YuxK